MILLLLATNRRRVCQQRRGSHRHVHNNNNNNKDVVPNAGTKIKKKKTPAATSYHLHPNHGSDDQVSKIGYPRLLQRRQQLQLQAVVVVLKLLMLSCHPSMMQHVCSATQHRRRCHCNRLFRRRGSRNDHMRKSLDFGRRGGSSKQQPVRLVCLRMLLANKLCYKAHKEHHYHEHKRAAQEQHRHGSHYLMSFTHDQQRHHTHHQSTKIVISHVHFPTEHNATTSNQSKQPPQPKAFPFFHPLTHTHHRHHYRRCCKERKGKEEERSLLMTTTHTCSCLAGSFTPPSVLYSTYFHTNYSYITI
mmetsp:Transcript_49743/g.120574  ORF Transcript_49743/g.120574 Transcript_49743/m.120574 type:complete len:303 (-) Transcript_49743:931-1839(-)